ncbi:Hypothetical_protein [Hexamita inflata]|uniref:Hypothetical_protein n=1 Tax=Hexamita inflata TaxID=28002 RepID=A0AA86RCE2_9EUKA|nr:Hypothetical protein HINF_LOCUS58088 [Hexamita inflata]
MSKLAKKSSECVEQNVKLKQSYPLNNEDPETTSVTVCQMQKMATKLEFTQMIDILETSLSEQIQQEHPLEIQRSNTPVFIESDPELTSSEFQVISISRRLPRYRSVCFHANFTSTVATGVTLQLRSCVPTSDVRFQVFKQYNFKQSPGIVLSTAKLDVQVIENIITVGITFDENDQGCLVYLSVQCFENLAELIPVTFKPVQFRPEKQKSTFRAFWFNFKDKAVVEQKHVLGQNLSVNGTQENWPELVDLNPETVNPDILNEYLGTKSIVMENIETRRQHGIIRRYFGRLLDYESHNIIAPNSIKSLIEIDSENIFENVDNFIVLQYEREAHLLYFDTFQNKQQYIHEFYKQAGMLFEQNYIDEDYEMLITHKNDLQNLQIVTIEEFKNSFDWKLKFSDDIVAGKEISLRIKNPDGPIYICFIDQQGIVRRTLKFESQPRFLIQPQEGGMKISVTNGRFSCSLASKQWKYTRLNKYTFKKLETLQARRKFKDVQVYVFVKNKLVKAKLQIDQSSIVLRIIIKLHSFDLIACKIHMLDYKHVLIVDKGIQILVQFDRYDDLIGVFYYIHTLQGYKFKVLE